jgi:hypothetical protein
MLLLVFLIPSLAFGQPIEAETTILPPAPPPPSTDWIALGAVGLPFVLTGAQLVRGWHPFLHKGWPVPVIVVPLVSLGVALYQVGPSDLKLLLKHSGILWLAAYGGHTSVKQFLKWAAAMIAAMRAGTTLPPPPDLVNPESIKVPLPSKLPPLPVIMTFSLLALGCGATNPCAVAYKKAADCPDCTGDEIRARVAEVDQSCAYQLEGGSR